MEYTQTEEYLGGWIKAIMIFQVLTTGYMCWKTLAENVSAISYNGKPIPLMIYFGIIIIQCGLVLYLLFSIEKKPKRWKAWLMLFSTLLAGNIIIEKHSHGSSFSTQMSLIGVPLVICCLILVYKTHKYMRVLRKEKKENLTSSKKVDSIDL